MKKHWRDLVNLVLGLWLFISPWILLPTMATGAETSTAATDGAMWNLYIVGISIAGLAAVALIAFQAWGEWTSAALGAWLLVSPWMLGFSSSPLLTWNAVIVGVLVLFLAARAAAAAQGPEQHA